MADPNHSNMRSTKPLIALTTPVLKPHVVCMQILCGCSDGVLRQVVFNNEKLPKAVLGFIEHRQGGILQLETAEAMAVVSREKEDRISSELPKPRPGFKWIERADRRSEFEEVPDESNEKTDTTPQTR